jgi:tetratricopeptide (TPR) repeat protein
LGEAVLFFVGFILLAACSSKRSDDTLRFFQRGNIEMKVGNRTEAIRLYSEAIATDPTFPEAYNNRGVAHLKSGEYDKSISDFDRALQLAPDYKEAIFNRAQAFEKTGKFAESLKDLIRIADDYKDSAQFYLLRGNAYAAQNSLRQAFDDYDQAIARYNRDPRRNQDMRRQNLTEAYVNRGVMHFNLKDDYRAENDFRKALAMDSLQDFAYNNLAQIYIRKNRYDTALVLLDKAVSLNPNQPYYRNNRGFVKLQLGDLEAGVTEIRQSLALDNTNAWAYRNLGVYHLRKKNFTEALANLRKAGTLGSGIDLLRFYLGEAYLGLGDTAEACESWRMSKELGEKEAETRLKEYCK